jgi:protein TonB
MEQVQPPLGTLPRSGAAASGGLLLVLFAAARKPKWARQWLASATSVTLHGGLVAAFLFHAMGLPGRKSALQAQEADPSAVTVTLVPTSGAGPSLPGVKAVSAPPSQDAAPAMAKPPSQRSPGTASAARAASAQTEAAPEPKAARSASSDRAEAVEAQSSPAPAGPPGAVVATDYGQRILEYIEKYRRPNASGVSGLVRLTVVIDRRGDVMGVQVDAGSGSRLLDNEAQAMIWRARPLPPIPKELPDQITLTLPVGFDAYGGPGR